MADNAPFGAYPRYATDASGNVTGLLGPDGHRALGVSQGCVNTAMFIGDSLTEGGGYNSPIIPDNRIYGFLSAVLTNLNSRGQFIDLDVKFSATCVAGSGTLKFYVADSTLTWKAYGDTEGPRTPVDVGFYALESGSANNTLYVSVNPRSSFIPLEDASDSINIGAYRTWQKSNFYGHTGWIVNRFDKTFNYGISGIEAKQWSSNPQWEDVYTDVTFIHLGTNDIYNLDDVEPTIDAMKSIIQSRLNIGSIPVVGMLFPRGSITATLTGAIQEYNRQLTEYCRSVGVRTWDAYQHMADPAGSGGWRTDIVLNRDDLHLNPLGNYFVYKYFLKPIVDDLLIGKQRWAAFQGGVYDATLAPYGNLLPYGDLTGTGGTYVARASGDVPDGYKLGCVGGSVCTVVGSYVARNDGAPGNWYRMSLDNTGGVDGEYSRLQFITPVTDGWEAGDYVQFEAEIRLSGELIQGPKVGFLVGTTGNFQVYAYGFTKAAEGYDLLGDVVQMTLKTEPIMIEPGLTEGINPSIYCYLYANGTASIDVGRISVHKCPAPE